MTIESQLREAEAYAEQQRTRAVTAETQQAECMRRLAVVSNIADKLEREVRLRMFAVEGNNVRLEVARLLRGVVL